MATLDGRRLTFRPTPEEREALERLAQTEDRKLSELLRQAIQLRLRASI